MDSYTRNRIPQTWTLMKQSGRFFGKRLKFMSDFKFCWISISVYKISCGLFLHVYSCALLHPLDWGHPGESSQEIEVVKSADPE